MRMDRRLCGTRISTVDYQLQDEKKSQIFLQDKNGSKKRDLISHGFCFHVEGECNQTISGHDKKKGKKNIQKRVWVCVVDSIEVKIIIICFRDFSLETEKKNIFGGLGLYCELEGSVLWGLEGVHFGIWGEKYYLKIIGIYMISSSRASFFHLFFLVVRLMDNGCTCCVVGVFGY